MEDKKSSYQRTIVIVQRVLPHYRVEFFARLAQSLKESGVRLRVIYGQEKKGSVPRSVYPDEDWAEFFPNRYWSFAGTELVWQSGIYSIGKPELLIVEQASRLLVNYLLLVSRYLGRVRLAYWGHGRNFQSTNNLNIKEKIKRKLMKSVDWWFAYTQLSADIVSRSGYNRQRITVVENSINTDEFQAAISAISQEQLKLVREQLSIAAGPVALYCGGMYADKRVPFLLEAAELIDKKLPDFNLILIGSGPDENLAQQAAKKHQWIHYIGGVYGKERAVYFSLADVMLMPGLVGLAIVDSFVAGLPMITTDIPIHSPEIAYLQNNVNGVMTAYDSNDYANAVVKLLIDDKYQSQLQNGCCVSANRYTLDAMVKNFSAGILSCVAET